MTTEDCISSHISTSFERNEMFAVPIFHIRKIYSRFVDMADMVQDDIEERNDAHNLVAVVCDKFHRMNAEQATDDSLGSIA